LRRKSAIRVTKQFTQPLDGQRGIGLQHAEGTDGIESDGGALMVHSFEQAGYSFVSESHDGAPGFRFDFITWVGEQLDQRQYPGMGAATSPAQLPGRLLARLCVFAFSLRDQVGLPLGFE
jgi:hypothetical protein